MPDRAGQAREQISTMCKALARPVRVMEVCGTHTVAIFRSGIRSALPSGLSLLSGPGCPVCVTEQGYIDTILELAEQDGIIIATYGDMIRVPGSRGSLEAIHRPGVRVVLSTDDAVALAREHPDKMVVFAAVGFETTTPATAVAVRQAEQEGLDNFSILSGHKLVVPAMMALLADRTNRIDAFLCPGHVSVIIGSEAYRPVAERFSRPCVVAGFEPVAILEALCAICRQLLEGRAQVESLYTAVVRPEGNQRAMELIDQYFEPCDGPWRGLGRIPGGSLRLRVAYERFDARKRFDLEERLAPEPAGCRCGEVLCGKLEPVQCGLFAGRCTPDTPVGPCMVSSEGACAAWYKYGRRRDRDGGK